MDPQSQHRFQSYYEKFKARNTRDTHQDFSANFLIGGMVRRRLST